MRYTYHKLVRDKVPENIKQMGKDCCYKILEDTEYTKELDKKLIEEVSEWTAEHSVEEMADILEVIEAIQKNEKIEDIQLEEIKKDKKQKKGGFDKKIYLEEVEEKQEIKMAKENEEHKQEALWNFLQPDNSLKQIQQYIQNVNTLRGFEDQPIEEKMLLLTEEIGELAKAIRKHATHMGTDIHKQEHYDSVESEVSDCLYVLTCICNGLKIDMFECLKQKEKENIYRTWK